MPPSDRKDATLPSLVASLSAGFAEQAIELTILFHPCTERIGQFCEWPAAADRVQDIGRYQPEFEGAVGAGALAEQHISRRALRLEYREGCATLEKLPGTCRCLVQGQVLEGRMALSPGQLARGVILQLGHAVVLCLRVGEARGGDGAASALVGNSATMRRLRQQIVRAGATNLDVLILGETGVGKELTAAGIHHSSARNSAPLVSINMSAIPVSLAPALLFGSARGAYTGASRASAGYFQQAAGGTLFFDEIGATPAEIQPQLLRALQQREVQVVGGALEAVDVRVIAATDADLTGAALDFSDALRHRLGSVEILVPPLREHIEDLGELLLAFVTGAAAEMACDRLLPREDGDEWLVAQWAEVFRLFAIYDWPGNVRELGNAARQLLVASDDRLSVPPHLLQRLRQTVDEAPPPEEPQRPMAEIASDEFRSAYIKSGCEIAATARVLGVSRQSIYRRLEETPDLRLAADVPRDELEAVLEATGGDVRQAAKTLVVSYQGLRSRLRRNGEPR